MILQKNLKLELATSREIACPYNKADKSSRNNGWLCANKELLITGENHGHITK